ncbi:MAG: T9SS type A sorting domain-containing protein, partial [Cyclobacteriaceae bacterium]|nr:T9SS type A sorting domain-containing protein [Cyclobacteriaceae bacterium]
EVGDYAYPAFFDYDADGDQDMFIGNYGNESFIGVIAQYENIGTPTSASFRLITPDYLNLSQLVQFSIKPQFIDINSDGNMDLAFGLADPTRLISNLLYIPGNSPNTLDFANQQILNSNFWVFYTENMLLEDIDQDGKVDLLVGRSNGALEYWRNTAASGSFQFVLENPAFMGLGESISRNNLTAAVADLDNDGRSDLMTGDQGGRITIFGDFRNTINFPQPVTDIVFDSFSQTYSGRNLGGRIKPVATNLFNSDKPSIAVGTVSGGMLILKNDGGQLLSDEPEIVIYPNPIPRNDNFNVKSDRNVLMQVFTIMGQKLTEPVFITANQPLTVSTTGLLPGIYIVRFTYAGLTYGQKFVIY